MLQRDPSCARDLLWRLELPPPLDATHLATRLLGAGWTERSRFPALHDLEGPEGHRVVIVPRTGRVQLRVSYLVPPEQRATAAAALAARLVAP